MYSLEKIRDDLKQMGVKRGDTVLVRADLGAIGKLESRKREDYVNFLLEVVGEEGTIIGLSFTNSFFIKKDKNILFDGTNKSYTGAFANTMLKDSRAIRSKHPTNSYVAIGKNAEYILGNHDAMSGAYEPIRKIIELNGKMILIGCVGSSPGFTTVHLAETDQGLHKRLIFSTLSGAYYKDGDSIKLFKRRDSGSCSSSFYKFYGYYLQNELLTQGYIGSAYSIMVDATKAYALEMDILKKNPKITICNRSDCMVCRAGRWDNLQDAPIYIIKHLIPKILRRVRDR